MHAAAVTCETNQTWSNYLLLHNCKDRFT